MKDLEKTITESGSEEEELTLSDKKFLRGEYGMSSKIHYDAHHQICDKIMCKIERKPYEKDSYDSPRSYWQRFKEYINSFFYE